MKALQIIGAIFNERRMRDGTYDAWYTCSKCGQELGCAEGLKTQEEAKEIALRRFDIQCRNYCYTCGNKLTDK